MTRASAQQLLRQPLATIWTTVTTVVLLCSAQILSQDTLWTQLQVPLTNMSEVHSSWSLTDCASTCAMSTGCTTFCRRESTSECYVDAYAGGPQLLSITSDVLCFQSDKCPSSAGYALMEGRCMKLYSGSFSHEDSQKRCEQDQAHLYHYKSLAVDRPALSAFFSSKGISGGYYWMGADDKAAEGNFKWSDGTSLSAGDPVWNTGEPNNLGNEDCADFIFNEFGLNDENCDVVMSAICQIDM